MSENEHSDSKIDPPANTQVWTTTPPAEPGWYWLRGLPGSREPAEPTIVLVRTELVAEWAGRAWPERLEMRECEWSGPICPPK